MAEGFLNSFDSGVEVYSAGTAITGSVHIKAVQVMNEVGIDISGQCTKDVGQFIDKDFNYVITVCGEAREACPVFTGSVRQRIHIGFNDPAKAVGTQEQIMTKFRAVRDEIKKRFFQFYLDEIKKPR